MLSLQVRQPPDGDGLLPLTDAKVAALVKKLDGAVAANSRQATVARSSACSARTARPWNRRPSSSARCEGREVPLVVPVEFENGPADYGINPAAEVTVIVAKGGKVIGQPRLRQGRAPGRSRHRRRAEGRREPGAVSPMLEISSCCEIKECRGRTIGPRHFCAIFRNAATFRRLKSVEDGRPQEFAPGVSPPRLLLPQNTFTTVVNMARPQSGVAVALWCTGQASCPPHPAAVAL